MTVDSLAPPARLELTTLRLGGVRSIQVSYGGIEYDSIVPKNRRDVNRNWEALRKIYFLYKIHASF